MNLLTWGGDHILDVSLKRGAPGRPVREGSMHINGSPKRSKRSLHRVRILHHQVGTGSRVEHGVAVRSERTPQRGRTVSK